MGTDVEVGMRLDKKSGRLEVFSTKDSQKSEFERLRRLDALFIRKNVYVFPMDVRPPQKEMSRFLAKMALEAIFARFDLVSGTEFALEMIATEHYDNIREWARYGNNFDDWPYHYRAYFPEDTLMEHPETGKWVQFGFGYDLLLTGHPETFFIFSYHGHEFAINLGGPSVKGYESWLAENNYVSALVEKKGSYVHSLVEKGAKKHLLVPVLKIPLGNGN